MRTLSVYVLSTIVLSAGFLGCNKTPEPEAMKVERKAPVVVEFKAEDVVVGTGKEAKAGDKVKVNYTGTLTNGTEFDSSVGKDPFTFTLGKGEVIKGWDKGVEGMKVGGKRKLTIPHDLGYGDRGSPPKIPPRATLLFDVELLDVLLARAVACSADRSVDAVGRALPGSASCRGSGVGGHLVPRLGVARHRLRRGLSAAVAVPRDAGSASGLVIGVAGRGGQVG
jgi:FKBP-type peptidyl-prolyl cis-trans isomerase FkpA